MIFLAGCYDELTTDVGYPAWADYLEAHFRRKGLPGRTVLDLACGTGSLTWELAARGLRDDRGGPLAGDAGGGGGQGPGGAWRRPPFSWCQSMDRLDLYGTIDACVCCLDSVNYVTDPQAAEESLCPGLAVSHARRAVPVRHQYAVQAAWAGRAGHFWTRRRTPIASGGRSMRSAAGSAPISWTFSAWIPAPACGSGERSCTGSGPMSRRN